MWESLRAVSSGPLGLAYVALRPEMLQILRGLRLRGRGAQRQKSSAVHFSLTEETP
jgi:hypothetical protein